ncbi:NAD(P)/FAD-dependent oxidoreductase [Nocardioides panacihumi]|uniref:NAD(P)/FAD-dependent oxidoreductase n=1 Tax=Nocardioides panacihumi TaxID=400774 RepID=A0ABP5CWF8_9ACTN
MVGARVAGASTAMLLARAGARVLLLDRGRRGADMVSTHALMRAGVLQLSRWGLLERVVAAGTPAITSTTFRYPGEAPVTVAIRPSPGVEALYAPRRTVLDAILVDAAVEAGVEVRHATAVTGLLRDDTGRVRGVRTSGGDLAARYVVGADGVRSLVAAEAGAALLAAGRHRSAVRYTYVDLDADADAAGGGTQWLYGDGVAGGVIPTGGGASCVFVSSTPARLGRMRSEDQWRAALSEMAPGHPAVDARRVDRFHGWSGLPGVLRQASGPGWVLVGDAGFYKDPMSTHGITDALRDAELAANAVVAALAGDHSALPAFGHLRDELARPMLDVSDRIASYSWRGAGVVPLVKELSVAMADEVVLLEGLAAVAEGAA